MTLPITHDHTVHEVSDLADVFVWELTFLDAGYQGSKALVDKEDPSFAADLDALKNRFGPVLVDVKNAAGDWTADTTPSWDYMPLERDWTALLAAWWNGGQSGATSGSYDDLYRRYITVRQAKPLNMGNAPQPTAPDLEWQLYVASDKALKAIKRVVSIGVPAVAGVALLVFIGLVISRK